MGFLLIHEILFPRKKRSKMNNQPCLRETTLMYYYYHIHIVEADRDKVFLSKWSATYVPHQGRREVVAVGETGDLVLQDQIFWLICYSIDIFATDILINNISSLCS